MTRQRTRDLRERASDAVLEVANMVRRVAFGASARATSGGLWSILGYETDDESEGDDDEPVETFQGICIYARPATSDKAEALMFSVGAHSDHPTLGAFRNEDARKRMIAKFGDIDPGEAALFPSAGDVRILLKADGTIEIGAEATEALATKADVQRIRDELNAHTHTTTAVTGGGGAVDVISVGPAVTSPDGTTILKGE